MRQAFLLITILGIFSWTTGQAQELTPEQLECRRQELLRAQQRAVAIMNAEEIEAALTATQERIEGHEQDVENTQSAERLAELLVEIEQTGKVKIENCTQLTIKEENPRAQRLLAQIIEYCQNSPQGFWAEMTKEGELKFTFATGSTNGTRSLTLGGSTGVTLGYRGHEIKLTGNASKATVGSGDSASGTTKYDAAADYSINLGITNIESFLRWKTSYESTHAPDVADANIRRNSIDLGLRYVFFDSESLTMKVGGGVGLAHLDQVGPEVEPTSNLRPIASASYDFRIRPTEALEMYLNASLQRDLVAKRATTILGGKAGAKYLFGPVGVGLEYSADYDSARTGQRVNHQFTFNIGASLNPKDWRKKEDVDREKKQRAREQIVWERALERVRQSRTTAGQSSN